MSEKKELKHTYSDLIEKLIYHYSDPDNWHLNLKQLCQKYDINYERAKKAVQRYGKENFWRAIHEEREKYKEEIRGKIAKATRISLDHIISELQRKDGNKWKAMWHLREFMKVIEGETQKILNQGSIEHRIKIVKQIIGKEDGKELDTKGS